MLGELSEGEDKVELEQALAVMYDARKKKKDAQQTFVQARAVVRDIKKTRKFFRPRKPQALATFGPVKKPNSFPKRSNSAPPKKPSTSAAPAQKRLCVSGVVPIITRLRTVRFHVQLDPQVILPKRWQRWLPGKQTWKESSERQRSELESSRDD